MNEEKSSQVTLAIVPAATGWRAVICKEDHELETENLEEIGTIHDVAWIEPIPCFALVERREPDGEEVYVDRMVLPVLRLESTHFGIPEDGYTDAKAPDLILGPGEDHDDRWVLKSSGSATWPTSGSKTGDPCEPVPDRCRTSPAKSAISRGLLAQYRPSRPESYSQTA